MQATVKQFAVRQKTGARFYQAVLWLAIAVFVLQFLGTARHNHDLTEHSSDCVSCYLVADFPSDIPAATLEVFAAPDVVAYRIALLPAYLYLGEQSYLIPLSQAPPSRSFQA